jgi:hypothetical protein
VGLRQNLNIFGAALLKYINPPEPNTDDPDKPWADPDHDVMGDLRAMKAAGRAMPGTEMLIEQGKRIGDAMAVTAATMQGRTFGRADRVYRREYRFDGTTRYRTSLIHLADHHVGGSRIYCDVGGCKKSYPKANLRAWRHHFWRDHTV